MVGTTGSVFRKNRLVRERFAEFLKKEYPAAKVQPPGGITWKGP